MIGPLLGAARIAEGAGRSLLALARGLRAAAEAIEADPEAEARAGPRRVSAARRARLLTSAVAAQGGRCYGCSREFGGGLPATLDRIVPGARGGAYSEANTAALCRPCNLDKGEEPPAAWIARRAVAGRTARIGP